jgi:hypothetical protein
LIDFATEARQAWLTYYYETGQLPERANEENASAVYLLVSQPLHGYAYGCKFKLPFLVQQCDFTGLYMDMSPDKWGEDMLLHFMSSKAGAFQVSLQRIVFCKETRCYNMHGQKWHIESGGAAVW